jgi:hypothetical protein
VEETCYQTHRRANKAKSFSRNATIIRLATIKRWQKPDDDVLKLNSVGAYQIETKSKAGVLTSGTSTVKLLDPVQDTTLP